MKHLKIDQKNKSNPTYHSNQHQRESGMRRFTLILTSAFLLTCFPWAAAQELYSNDQVDYTLELPSATWRAISQRDAAHEHAEFVNGDRLEGYLQVRKESVEAGTTPSDLARRDQDQKLRFLPGFIEGKEEKFVGRLNGVTISYEYVRTGKTMMGRIYYLQADNRTIYALRFSGLRDRLARIRNQTDLIARSFKLK